jgi:hypothetical protein
MPELLYPSINLLMRLVFPELGFPITIKSIFVLSGCVCSLLLLVEGFYDLSLGSDYQFGYFYIER